MRKLVIMTAMLLTACGDGAVSPDEYLHAIRDARCRYLVKCGEIESLDTCRAVQVGGIGGSVALLPMQASLRAAIDKGLTTYDGGSVERCLDAFATRDCDATSQSNRVVPEACLQAFRGTLHSDAACALDTECISLHCDIQECSPDTACCTSTCTGDTAPVRARLGESCETSSCEDNLICDDATLLCVALKPADAFCVSPAECAFGLDCLPTGTCAALPKLGDPCTGPCRDEGTTCSATSHICVKVALAGEACTTSADCSPIYRCDTSKHCSLGPKLGESCMVDPPCADPGAFCDIPLGEAMGTCALPKADGSPCLLDPNCQSQYCDPAQLLCAPDPV
ncbi:MAG TPA: hypothetical protein VHN14_15645, partial [Kofleriaceae bacterium]|nr:hypothetical protein [Kofleriaceae bacterium]